jgi:uncharacterized membrane protein
MPKLKGLAHHPNQHLTNDNKQRGEDVFDSSFTLGDAGSGSILPAVHGSADGGAGLVGILDKLLDTVTRASDSGGSGFELLPGVQALGANIHPSLVHYPIALLSLFFLLELTGSFFWKDKLRPAASAMLYAGTLGAIATVAAGLYAARIVHHGQVVHEIMEWHEHLGITVALLAVVLSIWRIIAKQAIEGMARALHLFLASIMATCLLFGADLGGLMVYEHGVAVHQLQTSDDAHHHLGHP